jgi:hypothetical protein
MGNLIICLDKQPWDKYCAQPPCGIFDPTNDKIYTVLKNIYKDMDDVFQSDMFHMVWFNIVNQLYNIINHLYPYYYRAAMKSTWDAGTSRKV